MVGVALVSVTAWSVISASSNRSSSTCPPSSTRKCGSPSCIATERNRRRASSRLQATTLLLRSIATAASLPSARTISSQRRRRSKRDVDRLDQEVARQQRDVGRLVGLLALGVEELAQLAPGGADEQGGTVDLDRVDPAAGQEPMRVCSSTATVSGVIGAPRTTHSPLVVNTCSSRPGSRPRMTCCSSPARRKVIASSSRPVPGSKLNGWPVLENQSRSGRSREPPITSRSWWTATQAGQPRASLNACSCPVAGRPCRSRAARSATPKARCRSTGSTLTMRICVPLSGRSPHRCGRV